MVRKSNLGHLNNSSPIGQVSDNISGGELGEIHCTSDKIRNVLDAESQEQVVNIQNQLSELVTELRLEVDRISDEIGYKYREADYIKKIYYNSKLISKQRDYLFDKYPSLKQLSNEILLLFPDNLKQSMSDYVNNIYFEDLIYESFDTKKLSEIIHDRKNIRKLKDIYSLIDKLNKEGKNYLTLEHEDLYKMFSNNTSELINLIKYAGLNGIKILNLGQTHLNEIFSNNPKCFIEFIGIIGSSGIKNLDLCFIKLEEIFENNTTDFIELVRTAGLSGLRVLNLTANRIHKIFKYNTTDFILFIRVAGESGIKNLGLLLSGVGDIFIDYPEHLIEMVLVAGNSGIRNLRLNSCGFDNTFQGNMNVLREFLKACKESKVQSINLSNNHLNKYDEHIKNIDKIIEKIMEGK